MAPSLAMSLPSAPPRRRGRLLLLVVLAFSMSALQMVFTKESFQSWLPSADSRQDGATRVNMTTTNESGYAAAGVDAVRLMLSWDHNDNHSNRSSSSSSSSPAFVAVAANGTSLGPTATIQNETLLGSRSQLAPVLARNGSSFPTDKHEPEVPVITNTTLLTATSGKASYAESYESSVLVLLSKDTTSDATPSVLHDSTLGVEEREIPTPQQDESSNTNYTSRPTLTAILAEPGQSPEYTTSDSFSACILVMDENHRLPEWLAYHYYALPLRHLIVAVDPHSNTSPSEILNRWQGRMEIIQWTDSDFTDVNLRRRSEVGNQSEPSRKTLSRNVALHRKRQSYFYERCAKHWQAQNKTWTTFHDLDEYIVPNSNVLGAELSAQMAAEPGYVLKAVQQLRNGSFERPGGDTTAWTKHFSMNHCIPLPRAVISSKESNVTDMRFGVPDYIEPQQFDTLRWRYRAASHIGAGPRDLVKSFLDVSQLAPDDFAKSSNPHLPIKRRCRASPNMYYNDAPLGFHHYIGSWEAYNYRSQDARQGGTRNYDNWKKHALENRGGPTDDGRPWIQGFVDLVGEEAAKDLLREAGLPLDMNVSQTSTSTS